MPNFELTKTIVLSATLIVDCKDGTDAAAKLHAWKPDLYNARDGEWSSKPWRDPDREPRAVVYCGITLVEAVNKACPVHTGAACLRHDQLTPYTVRGCRGHWHVTTTMDDVGGSYPTWEEASEEAKRQNALAGSRP